MVPSEVSGLYIVFLYTVDLLMNLATLSVRQAVHRTSHFPYHTGNSLLNRPEVDACRHPGDRAAPPSRYQVCRRHPGVSIVTKWLPRCRKAAALLIEINIFRIVSYFQCCSHLSKGWQGCQKLLDTVVARYSTRACAALLFARRNNIVYKKPCIGR